MNRVVITGLRPTLRCKAARNRYFEHVQFRASSNSSEATKGHGQAALTFGALGIVFGDIGTSPLYAMHEVFAGPHDIVLGNETVYGALSLIFWAITIIVSLKYVSFIMRADNHGEGGIMALIALVRSLTMNVDYKFGLVALGVFGAALFYGDALITPAISVLSAVEGIGVAKPSLHHLIIPATIVILTTLFAIQRFGSEAMGKLFGPVMVLWFATLAVLGISHIVVTPGILRALSPTYGAVFFIHHGHMAFLALGSVVLAVTGAEALYADMGHFGRPPIRRAWFAIVFPALILNYFGQGAELLKHPKNAQSPFYLMAPSWTHWPLVILATCAAVIASQAVISGAFSVTRQAVRLDFLPLLNVQHTSEHEEGQVYMPAVNWTLYIAIVGLVVGFGSSTALASAYGIAVTGTLAIDTILAFVVVRRLWHKPLWMVFVGAAGFLTVDLAFFTANLTKFFAGGWFPLVVAATLFFTLMTWQRGRLVLKANRHDMEENLSEFVYSVRDAAEPLVRVPGTAVFLTATRTSTPLALLFNVEHNHVLHENVVILTVETAQEPHVPESQRVEIDDLEILDDGIVLVTARYGFADQPDVPAALRSAVERGLDIDVDSASYFITHSTLNPGGKGAMVGWRKRLFIAMNRNSGSGTEYFGLPADRVVALGASIKI